MSQITTPTKEQILKAAECATPKEALEMLFPEVLKKIIVCRENTSIKEYPCATTIKHYEGNDLITIYNKSQGYPGFLLGCSFNWEIKQHKYSLLSLVPTFK